jgi:hypothetical protein
MKTIMSTLIALGVIAGAAHAHDAFSDPRQALPYSTPYEQALPRTSNDDYKQPLPRTSNDDYRDAVPFTDEVFPDIVIAKP